MFANVATAEDRIRHSPAGRDRGQDDAEREERVAVPFVDARRQHEEREREHREPDEQREPVRPPPDDPQHDQEGPDQERGPDRDRGHDAEHGAARPALVPAQRGVADPLAGAREADARV